LSEAIPPVPELFPSSTALEAAIAAASESKQLEEGSLVDPEEEQPCGWR
jgi:hypothetical protein